jgi:hypothetical protein
MTRTGGNGSSSTPFNNDFTGKVKILGLKPRELPLGKEDFIQDLRLGISNVRNTITENVTSQKGRASQVQK